jgi:hypothetical protein
LQVGGHTPAAVPFDSHPAHMSARILFLGFFNTVVSCSGTWVCCTLKATAAAASSTTQDSPYHPLHMPSPTPTPCCHPPNLVHHPSPCSWRLCDDVLSCSALAWRHGCLASKPHHAPTTCTSRIHPLPLSWPCLGTFTSPVLLLLLTCSAIRGAGISQVPPHPAPAPGPAAAAAEGATCACSQRPAAAGEF